MERAGMRRMAHFPDATAAELDIVEASSPLTACDCHAADD